MGKKRSAARRAAATATAPPAPAPIATPAVLFDTYAVLVDTQSAPAARESPTNTQQSRVSHEADAHRATRVASPARLSVDTPLVCEPANPDACVDTPVASATPQTRATHACPEPSDPPPALSTAINTSCDSPRQPHVKRDIPARSALHAPFPAPSAVAAADLATAIAHSGPPDLYFTSTVHDLDRLDARNPELDALAPRTRPATSIAEIDPKLLVNIIEDAQRAIRIEARREVRVKALEEGRERGWNEGLEEGRKEVRRAAREEARIEESQRERAWKDGYEQGRWEGYREGLDVARTEVSTSPRVETSVQTNDAPRTPFPTPDTSTTIPHIHASVQTDVSDFSHAPPVDTIPTTSHTDACVQFDAATLPFSPHTDPQPLDTTPRVNVDVQTDHHAPLTPSMSTFACTTTPRNDPATPHVDAGVQSDVPASNTPAPITSPSTHAADNRHTSTHACARTVHEIEPDLLREILAAAIAKGEAAGLKKGKHVGFQDGMEAGWKSGTREGHREGYSEGKEAGIEEGREQFRLEVSRIPRAVAAVQMDDIIPPALNPTPSVRNTHIVHTTPHASTTLSDNSSTSHNDHSLSHNDPDVSFTTAHTQLPSFSWADEASSLPIITPAPLISPLPRDFSGLRSSSARPFDSLKQRARRSQPRPARLSHPSHPFIPISEPVITRRHPAGLRADRPAVVVSLSSPTPHLIKSDTPPLDWQGDPRLQELGRVLRGLGWVRGSGS